MDQEQSLWALPGLRRLRWPLFSPITSIRVLDNGDDDSSSWRPFVQTQNDSSGEQRHEQQEFHPVAADPVSDPPMSSIVVSRLETVETWINFWHEIHYTNYLAEYEPEGGVVGAPCVCCGARPFKRPDPLEVSASDAPFVTVRDYVAAVHPWLLGIEEMILQLSDCSDSLVEGPWMDGYEPTRRRFWVEARFLNEVILTVNEQEES